MIKCVHLLIVGWQIITGDDCRFITSVVSDLLQYRVNRCWLWVLAAGTPWLLPNWWLPDSKLWLFVLYAEWIYGSWVFIALLVKFSQDVLNESGFGNHWFTVQEMNQGLIQDAASVFHLCFLSVFWVWHILMFNYGALWGRAEWATRAVLNTKQRASASSDGLNFCCHLKQANRIPTTIKLGWFKYVQS